MPTLLERDRVLAEMDALATTAARGTGQMLLLRGEAGVGKTALLHRFIDMVSATADVLFGSCDPLSAPRLLGPIIDMFGRLSGAHAAELSDAIDTGNTESVYKRLLQMFRDGHRWICVIDDAQWADDATLDLVRFLARRIETIPVLVVVSYRDYELGQGHPLAVMLGDVSNHAATTRISLSPLTVDAVGHIAAGSGLDVEQLHRLTGGNPFYVNEMLASGSTPGPAALPRSVSESAWGRLARLSTAGREAAEVVAVCGPDVDARLVETLCSGAAAGLNECVRAGLLIASENLVRFRHELVRLATLEQIPDYVRSGIRNSAVDAGARLRVDTHPPLARQSESRACSDHLTRREREILELLALGHSDAEIASTLFISHRTVNNHVHAILHKLGAQNRTQAATFARRAIDRRET